MPIQQDTSETHIHIICHLTSTSLSTGHPTYLLIFSFPFCITIKKVPRKHGFLWLVVYPDHLAWPESDSCSINISWWMKPGSCLTWCSYLLPHLIILSSSSTIFLTLLSSIFFPLISLSSASCKIICISTCGEFSLWLFMQPFPAIYLWAQKRTAIASQAEHFPTSSRQVTFFMKSTSRVHFSPGHLWEGTGLVG